MDAQGIMRVQGVGKVSLISIVDVTSRLKAESYPSLETTNPALEDYQLTLRRAFLTYGFPQVLTLDHGTVFYDNTTPSPLSHQITPLVTCPWCASTLYTQALPNRSCHY